MESAWKSLKNRFIDFIRVEGFLLLNLIIERIFEIVFINMACKMSLSYLLKYFAFILSLSRSLFRYWAYIYYIRIVVCYKTLDFRYKRLLRSRILR